MLAKLVRANKVHIAEISQWQMNMFGCMIVGFRVHLFHNNCNGNYGAYISQRSQQRNMLISHCDCWRSHCERIGMDIDDWRHNSGTLRRYADDPLITRQFAFCETATDPLPDRTLLSEIWICPAMCGLIVDKRRVLVRCRQRDGAVTALRPHIDWTLYIT